MYGRKLLLLETFVDEDDFVGLKECLKETYPDLWQEIITCALFEISEAKPLYLCNPWLELTYNEQLCGSLTSQRISELLRDIGEASRDRIDFFRLWLNMQRETKGWRNYLRISKKAERLIIGRRTSKKMSEQNLFKDYTTQEIIYTMMP